VAKIRGINIVGAQAFSESELVSLFVLRTPGLAHLVHQARPLRAREALRPTWRRCAPYYQNRGYLDFAIESTQVSITPDRHDIYITVNLSEGERYTVSDVQLSGQTPVAARAAREAGAAQARRRVLAREARRRAPRRSASASATTATPSPTPTPSRTSTRKSAPSRSTS
jgi:outer membrane protein insertion porin family